MAEGIETAVLTEAELLLAGCSTLMQESASVVKQTDKICASGVMAINRRRLQPRARKRLDWTELEQFKRIGSFQ